MELDNQDNFIQHLEFEEEELATEVTEKLETDEDSQLTESDFSALAQKASGIEQPEPENESLAINPEDLYPNSQVPPLLDPNKPFLKIFIGVALTSVTAIVLLILGSAWSRIMNPTKAKAPPAPVEEPLDLKQQEIDGLKADLALIEQDSHEQENPEPVTPPQVEEPRPAPQPRPQPQPRPRSEPKPEPVDPYVRWAQLSGLGTVGSSDVARESQAPVPTANLPSPNHPAIPTGKKSEAQTEVARIASIDLGHLTTANSTLHKAMPSSLSPQSTGNDDGTTPASVRSSLSQLSPLARSVIVDGLGGSSVVSSPRQVNVRTLTSKQVPLGTTVTAELTNPLVWSDNLELTQTRSTITFTEPLVSTNGQLLIDEGSSLIVEVKSFEPSGLVVLDAIAISYTDSRGSLQQQEIPPNTLLIKSKNNEPLKAKVKRSGSNDSDFANLLNDALRAGARNTSRGTRSILNSTINSTLGQSRNRNSFSRDLIYQIEAGTKVSVYVNSLININE